MLRARFRLWAVLLLVFAIPAQGMAALAAGQCMAFGHHESGADAAHQAHTHDGAADEHDHDSGKSSHCGPCTACCASASIAGPVGVSIPSWPSDTNYLFVQLAPPGFQPERLDRPPLAL